VTLPRAMEPFCLALRGNSVNRSSNGRQKARNGVGVRSAPALRRIVYYSTIGVYGDHAGAWVEETSATRTRTARGLARLEDEAQVVAEEPGQAGQERRHDGPLGPRLIEARQHPARLRERLPAQVRPDDDGQRICRQEGPPRAPPGPGALEENQAGQPAEQLGRVDRGDPVQRGQAVKPDGRQEARLGAARRGGEDHLPIIAGRAPSPDMDRGQAAGVGTYVFSIGTPTMLPHSVQLPS